MERFKANRRFVSELDAKDAREQEWISPLRLFVARNVDEDEIFFDLGDIARGNDTADQTSTMLRSNYRSLRRDFPEVPWIDVSYNNVNSLGIFAKDLARFDEDHGLIEILAGLKDDYGLYDESDLSELESEEEQESIESWVIHDVELDGEEIQDAWHELPEDQQITMVRRFVTETENYPEHNGLEVHWDMEALGRWLTEQLS